MNPFDQAYDGTPPWEVGRPQAPFVKLVAEGAITGRVLDLGCGTGEVALHVAATGLETWGIDLSARALTRARSKALARDVRLELRLHDALDLPRLAVKFDTFLDCGLFHGLSDAGRVVYERSVGDVAQLGSVLHLLCFSNEEPDWGGPRRVTRDAIESTFSTRWVVESIGRSHFESRERSPKAWLARLTFVGKRSRVAS